MEDSRNNLALAVNAGKLHKDGAVLAPKSPEDTSKDCKETYVTAPHIAQVARLSDQLRYEVKCARYETVLLKYTKGWRGMCSCRRTHKPEALALIREVKGAQNHLTLFQNELSKVSNKTGDYAKCLSTMIAQETAVLRT